mgnify:CR=1 FL=1
MDEQLLYSWQFSAQCLAQLGLDAEALFKRHGVDLADLPGSEEQINMPTWRAILDDAITQSGDPDLGLKYCQNVDLAGYGPIGFAMLSAETLGQGLEIVCRYVDLAQGNTETRITRTLSHCEICFRSLDAENSCYRPDIDCNLSFCLALLRYCLGEAWQPELVELMYSKPANIAAHQKLIRAPLLFSCSHNKVIIKPKALDTPMPSVDHRLCDILCRDLERLLQLSAKQQTAQDDLLSRVRSEIGKLLCSGAPKIEIVAKHLDTSSRSLQRHLSEEGYSFKALVEETRQQLAESYIRSTSHTLTDIAFMLGYSETSAFTRAFRRWTGMTPLQFRKQP